MDTYCDALNAVLEKLNCNFNKSNNEKVILSNEILNYLDLLGQVYNATPNSPSKVVFDEVRSDLLSSLIFCFEGYYRHSNICLRSSLELTLSYLYYSDNLYDFILWKNDCIDMTWTKLVDSEKGFFNPKFLNIVFGDEIDIKACVEKVRQMYHLTSQYVHGKYEYMQQQLGDKIEYSEELVDRYFTTAKTIAELEIVLIYIRFHDEIIKTIDPEEKIILDRLLNRYEVIK
ncbi:hypothetical protein [Ruminococcus sp.]|uniref:hypothetical protein n=1 Tax=Ruminococcus sp. TaxID=41978 RepID=UPI003862F8A8